MTNEEYLARSGQMCPFCGSDKLENDYADITVCAMFLFMEVQCVDCDAEWNNVFTLTSFERL